MDTRLTAATAAALVLIASLGRADPVNRANDINPAADVEKLSLPDLDFPQFGLPTGRRFVTVDASGLPSASTEITVALNSYDLPETTTASSGIGRSFLL